MIFWAIFTCWKEFDRSFDRFRRHFGQRKRESSVFSRIFFWTLQLLQCRKRSKQLLKRDIIWYYQINVTERPNIERALAASRPQLFKSQTVRLFHIRNRKRFLGRLSTAFLPRSRKNFSSSGAIAANCSVSSTKFRSWLEETFSKSSIFVMPEEVAIWETFLSWKSRRLFLKLVSSWSERDSKGLDGFREA